MPPRKHKREEIVAKLRQVDVLVSQGQHRSTRRNAPKGRADEAALTAEVVALAAQYGRYGYRRIAAMRQAGRRYGTTSRARTGDPQIHNLVL